MKYPPAFAIKKPTLTRFERFRLRLAQFLAKLVVLALPERFRPEPPLPKIKKSLVEMATSPVPDLSLETTRRGLKDGPFKMPDSFLDREALTKQQKDEITKLMMKDRRTYEQQHGDAADFLDDILDKKQ